MGVHLQMLEERLYTKLWNHYHGVHWPKLCVTIFCRILNNQWKCMEKCYTLNIRLFKNTKKINLNNGYMSKPGNNFNLYLYISWFIHSYLEYKYYVIVWIVSLNTKKNIFFRTCVVRYLYMFKFILFWCSDCNPLSMWK